MLLTLAKLYWKQIAGAVLIIAFLLWIQSIRDARDDALFEVEKLQLEAFKKNTEVKVSNEQGKRATDALQAKHIQDIQHIGALYGKEINDDKKTIANLRSDITSRLRQQSEDYHSRLSNNVTDKTAGENSDTIPVGQGCEVDDNYVKTLEEAGAVCAADYGLCKSYVDSEQARIGVTSHQEKQQHN